MHFGLFKDEALVSIVSLFIIGTDAQFRKFATASSKQGKGYGTRLLKPVMSFSTNKGVERIWCNARIDKVSFYQKIGMSETSERFNRGGVGFVIMEKRIGKDV